MLGLPIFEVFISNCDRLGFHCSPSGFPMSAVWFAFAAICMSQLSLVAFPCSVFQSSTFNLEGWESYKHVESTFCMFFCCGKFKEMIGLKAPANYSAPFWTCNFSICLCLNPKLLLSVISELLDGPSRSITNYCYLWRHQDTSQNIKKQTLNVFAFSVVPQFPECNLLTFFGKTGARKSPPNHLMKSWISWIWDHNGNMDQLSLEHEMHIW